MAWFYYHDEEGTAYDMTKQVEGNAEKSLGDRHRPTELLKAPRRAGRGEPTDPNIRHHLGQHVGVLVLLRDIAGRSTVVMRRGSRPARFGRAELLDALLFRCR